MLTYSHGPWASGALTAMCLHTHTDEVWEESTDCSASSPVGVPLAAPGPTQTEAVLNIDTDFFFFFFFFFLVASITVLPNPS